MTCSKHPEIHAPGQCSVCGRHVCSECGVMHLGRLYCNDCVQNVAAPGQGQARPRLRPMEPEDPIKAWERQRFLGIFGGVITIAFAFLTFYFMTDPYAEGENFLIYGVAAGAIFGSIALIGCYEMLVVRQWFFRERTTVLLLLVLLPAGGLALFYTAAITIPFIGSIAPVIPLIGYSIYTTSMARARFPVLGHGTGKRLMNMLYMKIAILIAIIPLHEHSLTSMKGTGALLVFMILAAVGLFTVAEGLGIQGTVSQAPLPVGTARAKRGTLSTLSAPVAMLLVVLFVILTIAPMARVESQASLRISNSKASAGDTLFVWIEAVNAGGKDVDGAVELHLTNGETDITLASRDGMAAFSKWQMDAHIDYSQLGISKGEATEQLRHGILEVKLVFKGDVKNTRKVVEYHECSGLIPAAVFAVSIACLVVPRYVRKKRMDGPGTF